MRWLGLIVLLSVAGCGDDDFSSDGGTTTNPDSSAQVVDLGLPD